MRGKVTGYFVALPVMVGCCLGVTWLVGWVMGVGFTAWIADNPFAVLAAVSISAVAYLVHRDRKKRRHLHARNGRAVAHAIVDDAHPETNPARDRQCGSR